MSEQYRPTVEEQLQDQYELGHCAGWERAEKHYRRWAKAWKAAAKQRRAQSNQFCEDRMYISVELDRLYRLERNYPVYVAHLRAKLARAEERVRRARQESKENEQYLNEVVTEWQRISWDFQKKADRRLALLRQIEWSGSGEHDVFCVCCLWPNTRGHAADCPLGAEVEGK